MDTGPSYTVTDSAGIEIVRSTRPAWTRESAWRLEAEPRLEIGRVSGEDAYTLDRVRGVTVLDAGGVALGNGGDNTIRFYDAAGTFVRKVGGRGGGPEEFEFLAGLERVGQEIWGRQPSRSPIKVFDPEGRFLRSVSVEVPAGMMRAGARGVFDDGSVLVGDWPESMAPTPEPRIGMSTLVRVTAGRIDTLAVVPAVQIVPVSDRAGGTYQAFGPILSMAVSGVRLYHGFPERYEIVVRDTMGAVRRIVRRDWDPLPVTEAQKAEWAERELESISGEGGQPLPPGVRERRQAEIQAHVHPEHHPAFRWFEVSRDGHLWVERTDREHPRPMLGSAPTAATPTTWDVFDADGVWLGSVEIPARLTPIEFGEDYVAGVWRNEMDVEFVRVYGLERAGGR